MFLQEILLQNGVRLVIIWMGDCVEAQLDDLLAEGGDSVVESTHSSITPLALKRDSTWANHPAALSVQNGGSVIVLWLFAAAIVKWRV